MILNLWRLHLYQKIENTERKDFSSVPLEEIDFPKIVYLIVDKSIELEIKYLRDYQIAIFITKKIWIEKLFRFTLI